MTLLQAVTLLERCVAVARRMCSGRGWWGGQAEISCADSGDNGWAGTTAWNIITPKVFSGAWYHVLIQLAVWTPQPLAQALRLPGRWQVKMFGSLVTGERSRSLNTRLYFLVGQPPSDPFWQILESQTTRAAPRSLPAARHYGAVTSVTTTRVALKLEFPSVCVKENGNE